MKHLARILSLLILVSATLFIAACDGGGGEEPSEKDKQIDLLAGTWNATAVTKEGESEPHTADYAAFSITITKSSSEAMTYVTTGRPSGKPGPWNANGTLAFGSNVATELRRGDNVNIGYTVSGNTLVMTFTDYSGEGYTAGRTETAEGDWIFTLTK